MSLNTVTTGNTVLASDVNQLVNVLQRAATQTEVGKYFLVFWANAASDAGNEYMASLSRVSTPVSVTLDEVDQAHSNCNAITSSNLTANGYNAFTRSSGAATTCQVGGNATINF